jgi:hypothetical protein
MLETSQTTFPCFLLDSLIETGEMGASFDSSCIYDSKPVSTTHNFLEMEDTWGCTGIVGNFGGNSTHRDEWLHGTSANDAAYDYTAEWSGNNPPTVENNVSAYYNAVMPH